MRRRANGLGDISQHGNRILCFRNIYVVKPIGPPYLTPNANTSRTASARGSRPSTAVGSRPPTAPGSRPSTAAGSRPTTSSGSRPGTASATRVTPQAISSYSSDPRLIHLFDVNTIPQSGKIEFDFIVTEALALHPLNINDYRHFNILRDKDVLEILYMSKILQESRDITLCDNKLKYLIKIQRKQFIPSFTVPYWLPSFDYGKSVGEKSNQLYGSLSSRNITSSWALRPTSGKVPLNTKTNPLTSKTSPLRPKSGKDIGTRDNLKVAEGITIKQPAVLSRLEFNPHRINASSLINKFNTYLQLNKIGGSVLVISKYKYILQLRTLLEDKLTENENLHLYTYFLQELRNKYIECRQLSVILEFFRSGIQIQNKFGTYRVELVVAIFDRIIDVHNFYFILMVLNSDEGAALRVRIGLLSIFNPYIPEGGIQLDCSSWEERQVVRMITHLSVIEPGNQFIEVEFRHDRHLPDIPGWELNTSWFPEEGVPRRGILSVYLYSGEGFRNLNCKAQYKPRDIFSCLVLLKHRNLYQEIQDLNKYYENVLYLIDRDKNNNNIINKNYSSSISSSNSCSDIKSSGIYIDRNNINDEPVVTKVKKLSRSSFLSPSLAQLIAEIEQQQQQQQQQQSDEQISRSMSTDFDQKATNTTTSTTTNILTTNNSASTNNTITNTMANTAANTMANSNTTKSKSVIISSSNSASRRTSNEIASTSHDSLNSNNNNNNGFPVNFNWPKININSILSSIQQQTKLFQNYQTTQVRIYERTNPNFLYQIDEIHRMLRDRTDIKWTYHQK